MKNLLRFLVLWVLCVPCFPSTHAAQSLEDRVNAALASETQDFAAWQKLENELDRAEKTPRHELQRYQVLMRAAEALPWDPAEHDLAMTSWLKRHEGLIFYDEISSRNLVHVDPIWQLFERSKDSSEAEEIAWTAAEAPRGGECEGYLPCHVGSSLESAGRYLRHFPRGRHAQAAVDDFIFWLQDESGITPDDLHPDDRGALIADLERWRALLSATALPNRADLLSRLEKLRAVLTKKP
jgi:hypothetical protein